MAVPAVQQYNVFLGLMRIGCSDNNEPGRKHKIMRYEGVITEKDKKVFAAK